MCVQLKKIRLKSCLTQAQVTDHLCMTQNTYSRIENGKLRLDVKHIFELSRLFNVMPNDFYEDEQEGGNKEDVSSAKPDRCVYCGLLELFKSKTFIKVKSKKGLRCNYLNLKTRRYFILI